jgi:hypothetical protein
MIFGMDGTGQHFEDVRFISALPGTAPSLMSSPQNSRDDVHGAAIEGGIVGVLRQYIHSSKHNYCTDFALGENQNWSDHITLLSATLKGNSALSLQSRKCQFISTLKKPEIE